MVNKTKSNRSSSTKKSISIISIVFSIVVFIFALVPKLLHIGSFFQGVFGVMIYPICVLITLVNIAKLLSLRYSFDARFTTFIIISFVALLGLFHTIFSSKVLLSTYKTFNDFGAYLKATYTLKHGITVGGLILSILVFLLRALIGVGGAYVVFAITATLFIGLTIDYAVNVRKKKRSVIVNNAQQSEKPDFDENSGLSTSEYSFLPEKQEESNIDLTTFESSPAPAQTEMNSNLFEPETNFNYSFSDQTAEDEKTQNDERESAKSVLFGSNFQENSQNNETKEDANEPKSAHEILFGDRQTTIPNIFDRSSEERDAWRRQYASHPLSYHDEPKAEDEDKEESTFEKDDCAIKTSWGEYRPTSSFNSGSTVDDVQSSRARDLSRARSIRRDEPLKQEESAEEAPKAEEPRQNIFDNTRIRERRDIRERTSVSNFNKESSEEPVQDNSSRLNERRVGDILANASNLGVERREQSLGIEQPLGGERKESFSSILDSNRRAAVREEKPRQVTQQNMFTQVSGPYTPPPTNILNLYKEDHEDYSAEYKAKSEILENTLSAFKIPAKVINVVRGPKVTRYELSMPTGIAVNKILQYDRDMSMNLATKSGVRIEAPIPGKNAFGVEVENAKSSNVGLRELLESPEYVNFKGPLPVAVGKNISGEVVIKSLARMVHMLVAGSTGSGKSVFLHSLIMSLMYRHSPEELRFIMIDPKRVEFSRYNNMPHMMLPEIVNECSKAVNALNWAVKEMERRYDLLEKNRCQKLEQFNNCPAVKNGEEKKLPYLVIVVDELAELMSVAKKEVEGKIQRITQLGRAAGIHMVIATQRPSTDIITGVIKNNMPTRVALSLASGIDSQTVINQYGAEKLLGWGDMLLSAQDSNQIVRLQGAFVSDEEIEKILDFIKAHNACVYDEEVQKVINAEPEKEQGSDDDGSSSSDDRMDELMPQALKLVMKNGKASISMVQRRFSVGYARAARIIDQMETHGFIDGGIGNKPRDIKITIEEYNNLFGNFDGD